MSVVSRWRNPVLQSPSDLRCAFYCLISFYYSSSMLSLSASQSLRICSPFGLQHTLLISTYPPYIIASLCLYYSGINSNTTSSERHPSSKVASTIPPSVALSHLPVFTFYIVLIGTLFTFFMSLFLVSSF